MLGISFSGSKSSLYVAYLIVRQLFVLRVLGGANGFSFLPIV
jgi:hypothetical protein